LHATNFEGPAKPISGTLDSSFFSYKF
jgi:hypothetical protein